ncbi:MAG TPA: DUF1684 domain-containing protein [Candidatus Limnocylindrales bacterium]|nr:DUF1684 domain-containing protein [Candidatus Limnocylindrales bacterium]
METTPTDSVEATLALADWRRTVATLYADVRRIARDDVGAALDLWRTTREQLYGGHAQSPVPAADRPSFRARHFDPDPALRFEVVVEPPEADRPDAVAPDLGFGGLQIELPVSAGGVMAFRRFGVVTIPFPDGPRRLEIYWMEGYAGGLFLPFRDATNGRETYGAGRYLLDAAKSADLGAGHAPGSLILDFNFAYQPSCAFDPKWACPLAPPSNRLDLEIRAGERLA